MQSLANELFELLLKQRLLMVSAESCTGGLIAKTMTDIPGSSAVYERGFVTYSNQSKIDLLQVPVTTLEDHGAVSEQTASAMVTGALNNSCTHIGVSVTGIAGPDGGTDVKPIGLVYIATALKGGNVSIHEHYFQGTRQQIRDLALTASLKHLILLLDNQ